jgi:hypothetical protein
MQSLQMKKGGNVPTLTSSPNITPFNACCIIGDKQLFGRFFDVSAATDLTIINTDIESAIRVRTHPGLIHY